jgi:hypothetical protein
MEPNPYSAPSADPFGRINTSPGEAITEGILTQLKGTKGWVKLMAVMCFLGGGLMALGGLAVVAFGIFGGSILAASGMEGVDMASIGGAVGGVVIGALYALMGVLYFYPGFKLWGYASAIEDLLKDRMAVTLERALNEQRAFWKFLGVLVVVLICVYVLAIVGAVVVAVIAAAAGAGASSGA